MKYKGILKNNPITYYCIKCHNEFEYKTTNEKYKKSDFPERIKKAIYNQSCKPLKNQILY